MLRAGSYCSKVFGNVLTLECCSGSRLVIGPWTHGGLSNNPVGHQQQSSKSRFNQVKYAVQFMDHTLGHDGMDGHLAAGKKRNEGCNEGGPQREQSSKDEAGTDDDVTRVRIDTSLRQMADVISQSSTSMRRAALETASDTLVPSTVATSPFTADQGRPLKKPWQASSTELEALESLGSSQLLPQGW